MERLSRRPCVVILCLISCITELFSLVSSNTLTISGVQYLRFGDDLVLNCTTNDVNYNSTELQFKLGSSTLLSEKIDGKTIKLVIERPSVGCETYKCEAPDSQYTIKRVCVSRPPEKITDFKCVSKNLENMTCSWTKPTNTGYDHFELIHKVNGRVSYNCSMAAVDNKKLQCYMDINQVKQKYRVDIETYNFQLKFWNAIASIVQNFTINHYSVVKLNPPRNLKVRLIKPHEVELEWKIEKRLTARLNNLVYKIDYKIPKYNDTVYEVNATDVQVGLENDSMVPMWLRVTALPYAHTVYQINVSVKPASATDEFWSEPTTLYFTTPSEIPSRPPEIPAGAFIRNYYEPPALLPIDIYWKQLEEFEEAGPNFRYKYKINSNTASCSARGEPSRTLLSLQCKTPEAVSVTIWSENEVGSSVNGSTLCIPSIKDTDVNVMAFSTFAHQNGTYELSWRNEDPVDNYTLFWRVQQLEMQRDRFDYVIIDPNMSNYMITMPNYTYQFAISANKGVRSSGLIWSKCVVWQSGVSMNEFSIKLSYDEETLGNTSVTLNWSLDCMFKEGIINGYNIDYCPVYATDCTYTQYKINDAKQTSVVVTDLLPFKTYKFKINVKNIFGTRKIRKENVNTATFKTKEGIPIMPKKVDLIEVTNVSIVLDIQPPDHFNGPVNNIKYVFYNYSEEIARKKVDTVIYLDGLHSFSDYSITMKVFNENIMAYSNETAPIKVRTKIGTPGELEGVELNGFTLSWHPPKFPGGIINMYQVRITDSRTKESKIIDISNDTLQYTVETCSEEAEPKNYQVRAINIDKGVPHIGKWSDVYAVSCQGMPTTQVILYILAAFFILPMLYALSKYHIKLKKEKDLGPPIFPPGLMLPWEHPNETYDNLIIGIARVPNEVTRGERLEIRCDIDEKDVKDPLLESNNNNRQNSSKIDDKRVASIMVHANNTFDDPIISKNASSKSHLKNNSNMSTSQQDMRNNSSLTTRKPSLSYKSSAQRNRQSNASRFIPIRVLDRLLPMDYVKAATPIWGIQFPFRHRNTKTAWNANSAYVGVGFNPSTSNISKPAISASSTNTGYVQASFKSAGLGIPSTQLTTANPSGSQANLPQPTGIHIPQHCTVMSETTQKQTNYVLAAPIALHPFPVKKIPTSHCPPSPVLQSNTNIFAKSNNCSDKVQAEQVSLLKTYSPPLQTREKSFKQALNSTLETKSLPSTDSQALKKSANSFGYIPIQQMSSPSTNTNSSLSSILKIETKPVKAFTYVQESLFSPADNSSLSIIPLGLPPTKTNSPPSTVSKKDEALKKSLSGYIPLEKISPRPTISNPLQTVVLGTQTKPINASDYVQASLIPSLNHSSLSVVRQQATTTPGKDLNVQASLASSIQTLSNGNDLTATTTSDYVQDDSGPQVISAPETKLLSPLCFTLRDSRTSLTSIDSDVHSEFSADSAANPNNQEMKLNGYICLKDVKR